MIRSCNFLSTLFTLLIMLSVLPNKSEAVLGVTDIQILGLQVNLDTRPDLDGLQNTMTAVKDIPTGVQTIVGVPGTGALPTIPSGSLVKADLAGLGLGDAVVTLSAAPNQLMGIPPFKAAGDYRLFNVRLEDAAGNVVLRRDPALGVILINVIDELLVTQVSSRPLTLEEIQEKGIVIDEDNFTTLNFTIGLTLGSEQVVIDLPVAIPTTSQTGINLKPPQFTSLPSVQRQFSKLNIPNFSLAGFGLRPPPEFKSKGIVLPEINGIIIIPGNIAFLNQFFSVILQASNIAPDGSGLEFRHASAVVKLPLGDDELKGSGDDPLRIAETQSGGVQEELPLLDDLGIDSILPQKTNSAEFLIEGLREGTHGVTFDISGDLFVPALGETVPMTGIAAGVVQVKNPTFSMVLAHPDVVREGEAYSLFATVTNTSTTPANLFKLQLNSRSLTGARLADGETDIKTLDFLAPGQAESFEFRLIARTTGQVTGTVFLADEGINGSFILNAGVGDTGIPLSPDTLVLPQTVDYLPDDPDIVFAAVRMLGQAYSVATAPAGALPPDVARINRSFVFDRAVKVAQTGLHIRFGETEVAAAQDLVMDFFGNDLMRLDTLLADDPGSATRTATDLRAFDTLRRAADAGNDLSDVLGQIIGGDLTTETLATLQLHWAEMFATRPPHLSFGASSQGPPVFMHISDAEGNGLGRLASDDPIERAIPYADRLPLRTSDELLFIATPDSDSYTLKFSVLESIDVKLSLIVPDGLMQQVTWPTIMLPAGANGQMTWLAAGANDFVFQIDSDGDGTFDQTLDPDPVVSIVDRSPTIIGVHQWGKGAQPGTRPSFEFGDPIGRMFGVLFSEEVEIATAESASAYAVPGNLTTAVSLQPDRRLVFVVLEEPVGPFIPREASITNVTDLVGNTMDQATLAIIPDPDRGIGGAFRGRVLTADGVPVPFASVKYLQPLSFRSAIDGCLGEFDARDFVITTLQADVLGRFDIDFVLQSGFPTPSCPSNADIWLNENNAGSSINFKLEATDPETGDVGKASSRIHFDGQRLNFEVIIRGFGFIEGNVFDEEGNRIIGGEPDELKVLAKNISTGETYLSFVDDTGHYAFPTTFEFADGTRFNAPNIAVGNVILQIIRPSDGFTAVATVNIPGAGAVVSQDLVMVSPTRYGIVAGRVLEFDGVNGVANVPVQISAEVLSNVSLFSRTFGQNVVGSTTTDDQGFFQFDRIPAGDIELNAFRQASFEQTRVKSFLSEGETQIVTLVFPGSGGTVRGIVVDALGNPIPGATVAGGPTLTQADDNGFFEITGLPLGSFTIYAQSAGSPALGQVKIDSLGANDVQDIVIRLEPVGSITGSVFEADGVTPVAAQKVQLWVGSDGILAETFTSDDGSFAFNSVPATEYNLRAIRGDDGGQAFTSIRFADDTREADIRFRGLGEIKGRVIQSNGTPAITDVIITRKVWKIVTDPADAIPNPYLDFVKQLAGVSDQLDGVIDRVLTENNLNQGAAAFFVLVDEPVLLSSDILGPRGEVTGEFHFTGPVTGGPFTVAAFGPFLAPAELSGEIPVTTNPVERIVDVGDIVLEPATGSVTGTVFMPDGVTPVGENVKVKFRSLSRSGDIQIPGGAVQQPVLPEIDVLTDENGHFNFELVLRGSFVLTVDTGVPDPAIRADSAAEMQTELFLDEDGDRLLNVRLFGQTNGVVPQGENLDIDVRLLDVAGVDVQVVANDGVTPVPFALVTLNTESSRDSTAEANFINQVADANGFIDFFPVIEGMFSVTAQEPDTPARGQANGDVPVNPDNGHVESVTITLGAVTTASGQVIEADIFGAVQGTVFKADGTPMSNPVEVKVRVSGVEILTTSDQNGHYMADNVPGGFFMVEAFEPFTARRGSATGSLTFQDEVVDVPVTLVGLGTVIGEVLSNDGSQMLNAVDVVLFPSGRFTDKLISRTNAQGVYSLPGVPLGAYMVKANDLASGLTGEANDEMVNDGDTNTTDIFLEASGQIEGIVYAAGVILDSEGNPVDENGQSFVDPPVVVGASVTIKGIGFIQTVQSDSDGRFQSSEFLRLGDYSLIARPANANDGVTATSTISFEGETAQVAMILLGLGGVEGVLLDSIGVNPVETAQVTLHSESQFSGGPVTRFTDAQGRFSFEDVAMGEFSLSVLTTLQVPQLGGAASASLGTQGQTLAFVDGDNDSDHEAIRLQQAAAISGQILLPDAVTLGEGAIIELRGSGIQLSRIAVVSGEFVFEGVPLGDYILSVREPVSNGVAVRTVVLAVNGEELDLGIIITDSDVPTVVSVSPAVNSAGALPDGPIVVTFSEFIDVNSVNENTFRVSIEGTSVPGSFQVSELQSMVTFIPDATFPDLTTINVELRGDRIGFEGQVLESGISDTAGLGMAGDFAFQFQTGDSMPPALLSVSPSDMAVEVPLTSVIRFEFTEPLDPDSIQSFTVTAEGVVIDGMFDSVAIFGGRVWVFSPDDFLQPNQIYTATIQGPLADIIGNEMSVTSLSTSFATIDTLAPLIDLLAIPENSNLIEGATVPVTVNIGAAQDVVLVEFFVNGNIVATREEAPYTHNVFLDSQLGSELVVTAVAVDQNGNRSTPVDLPIIIDVNQAPNVAITSPSSVAVSIGQTINVTVAANDDVGLQQISFTANGGSIASDFQLVNAETSSQQTFSFKVPDNTPVGSTITLQASAEDISAIITFSEAVVLNVVDLFPPVVNIVNPANNSSFDPGSIVKVFVRGDDSSGIASIELNTSGALVSNETRQINPVASPAAGVFQVQIPVNALPTETIVITGKAIDGAGIAASRKITLRINDGLPPVVSVSAVAGVTDVEPGQLASVQVAASDSVGIRRIQLLVDGIGTQSRDLTVAAQVNEVFDFQVPENMPLGTNITVRAIAFDVAGNQAESAPLTLKTKDITDPTVSIIMPLDNSDVIPGESFEIRISANDKFSVTKVGFQASGVVSDDQQLVISPAQNSVERVFNLAVPAVLAPGGTITLRATALDSAGHSTISTAITVQVADIFPPQVLSISPADGSVVDNPNTTIVIEFDEAIAASSVNVSSFLLTGPDGEVFGNYVLSDNKQQVSFTPAVPLTLGAEYTLTVTGVADLKGNSMTVSVNAGFMLVLPDQAAPEVLTVIPDNEASQVPISTHVQVTFSEPLDPATVNSDSVILIRAMAEGAEQAQVQLGAQGTTLTLIPAEDLKVNTVYVVTLTTAITDLVGNPLAARFDSTFSTESGDIIAPKLLELLPEDGATDVSIAPVITASFDDAVLPTSVTPERFELRDDSDVIVPSTIAFTNNNQIIELRPNTPLDFAASYTVLLSGLITDSSGNAITDAAGLPIEKLSHTFTTGSFAITAPIDGANVPEGSVLQLEAGTGIALADVIFEVNGVPLAPVTGPPFRNEIITPLMAEVANLLIKAFGRDADGNQVASDEVSVQVVPGLQINPGILGVPLGGSTSLELLLTQPLTEDLPIQLAAIQPNVIGFPTEVVLPAGETGLTIPISGLIEGGTVLTVSSINGSGALVASVSLVESGFGTFVVSQAPSFTLLSTTTSIGHLFLPEAGTRSVEITLLDNPVATNTTVLVTSSEPGVVNITEPVTILAGSQVTTLLLQSGVAGNADLMLVINGEKYKLSVIVGTSSGEGVFSVVSQAPSFAVLSTTISIGHLILPEAGTRSVEVTLLDNPVATNTTVQVSSSNPGVVNITEPVTIPAGSQVAALSLESGVAGEAELTLQVDSVNYKVKVTVGSTPANFAIAVAGQPVGIVILPEVIVGTLILDPLSEVILRVPLLSSPATEEITVQASSRDSAIADVVVASAVIPVGSRFAEFTIVSNEVSADGTIIDLVFGSEMRTISVIVGVPDPKDAPLTNAPTVGMSVGEEVP